MEPRTFTNAVSVRVTGGIVAAFAAAGLAVGAQSMWSLGAGIALVGAALSALQTLRTRQTIVCDDVGVTVTTGHNPRGVLTTTFAWRDVTSTRYVERTVSAGAVDCALGTFIVENSSATLLEVTRHWRDFAAIVAVVNDQTGHLPYAWLPSDAAAARDRVQDAGAYCKVARVAVQYSNLRPIPSSSVRV
jgi:hypothetical protein